MDPDDLYYDPDDAEPREYNPDDPAVPGALTEKATVLSQDLGPKCYGCGQPLRFGMAHQHLDCYTPSEQEIQTVGQFIRDQLTKVSPPPAVLVPMDGDDLTPWVIRIYALFGRVISDPDGDGELRALLKDFLRAHPPAGPLL